MNCTMQVGLGVSLLSAAEDLGWHAWPKTAAIHALVKSSKQQSQLKVT